MHAHDDDVLHYYAKPTLICCILLYFFAGVSLFETLIEVLILIL